MTNTIKSLFLRLLFLVLAEQRGQPAGFHDEFLQLEHASGDVDAGRPRVCVSERSQKLGENLAPDALERAREQANNVCVVLELLNGQRFVDAAQVQTTVLLEVLLHDARQVSRVRVLFGHDQQVSALGPNHKWSEICIIIYSHIHRLRSGSQPFLEFLSRHFEFFIQVLDSLTLLAQLPRLVGALTLELVVTLLDPELRGDLHLVRLLSSLILHVLHVTYVLLSELSVLLDDHVRDALLLEEHRAVLHIGDLVLVQHLLAYLQGLRPALALPEKVRVSVEVRGD